MVLNTKQNCTVYGPTIPTKVVYQICFVFIVYGPTISNTCYYTVYGPTIQTKQIVLCMVPQYKQKQDCTEYGPTVQNCTIENLY